jgi:hypothetical protein
MEMFLCFPKEKYELENTKYVFSLLNLENRNLKKD